MDSNSNKKLIKQKKFEFESKLLKNSNKKFPIEIFLKIRIEKFENFEFKSKFFRFELKFRIT